MRVISNRIIFTEKELKRGKIIEGILEIERITRCMESELLPGPTAEDTKENMYMIKNKVKESFSVDVTATEDPANIKQETALEART